MHRNKKLCKILSVMIIAMICIFSPIKANAQNVDSEIQDTYKEWNIKFNLDIYIDDEIKKEVIVRDQKGESINVEVKLKDSKTITVYPPKEGYKDGQTYTIDINTKFHSKNSIYLKLPFKYMFKVNSSVKSNNKNYKYKKIIDKTIEATLNDKILKKDSLSDWEAIALSKGNKKIPSSYVKKIEEDIDNNELIQPTDYERTVLGMIATDEDPLDFNGHNLVKGIYNNEDMNSQGINAYIFALIALDSKEYEVPKSALWSREKLIKKVLDVRTEDKGWDFVGIKADPDMTGMAITALAPYKNKSEVSKAIEEAVNKLSSIQNLDGTFSCYGMKNSESISQVIIGLCANDVDPTSRRFTKGGKNLIDALLTFKTKDGGFAHEYKGVSNEKATEQVILALEAYRNLKTSNEFIYKFK